MKREFVTDIPVGVLKKSVTELGLKPFTAGQLIRWLYRSRVQSFDEMTNISKNARRLLKERYEVSAVSLEKTLVSDDGTRKFLVRLLRDSEYIECVLIPAKERQTACVSTQAGCEMGCAFCRTAKMGWRRNLTLGEITGQLVLMMREAEGSVSNVVLMGMGEPLANLENVSCAITVMCDENAFGLGKRRVTISTSGLVPELELAAKLGVKLAISLNATTDDVRSKLMPVNRRCPISALMKFCREYSKVSRYRITFEYVMLSGVNDSQEDAKRLVKLLKGINCKVNLIPFNEFEDAPFKAPDSKAVKWWDNFLFESGIQVNLREGRGRGIYAACGQLATISDK